MGNKPRWFEPGTVLLLTSKTLEGGMYMTPDMPAVNETVIGVVARGQCRHRVTIHGVAFLANHFHMVVTGGNPEQIAAFMQYVKSNLTRRINVMRKRTGTMWQRRYDLRQVVPEHRAQVQTLAYVLAHGAKEGLVERPEEWPGVSSAAELLHGADAAVGSWQRRAAMGRTTARQIAKDPERFEEKHRIELTPLPTLAAMTVDEQRAELRAAVDATIARHAPGPVAPGAVERIKAQDWRRKAGDPDRREPADEVAASASDRDDFRAAFEAIAAFHREASIAHIAGLPAEFPAWTFPSWQRMGGPDGLRFGRMGRRERREWARRKKTGVYRDATGPPGAKGAASG